MKKKKILKDARDCEKLVDYSGTFDHKFYRNYLDCLEKSINFRNECTTDPLAKAEEKNYDDSIYDCYKLCMKVDQNKYNWVEAQNSKNFELSTKKLSLLRMKTYAENGNFSDIENTITKVTLKKLGLTPLNIAEIYFEYKQYDKAVEYIKQITEADYFDYKIDMLQFMEKYEDALEIIISDKNKDVERMKQACDDILAKRPDLKKKLDELCLQYKVNLS